MANNKLFRSAIGGYNKQDVKKYIEELDIAATNAKEELEGKVRELENEKDELFSKLSSLEEELPSLRKAQESADALLEEKTALEASIIAQAEKYKEEIDELRVDNSLLLEQIANMQEEKAKEEQEAANVIKNLLERARQEAQELVSKAKDAADKIVSDAKEKATADAQKTKEESNELVKTNLEKVRYLNKRKNELSDIFRDHKSKVDSFFSAIADSFKGEGK